MHGGGNDTINASALPAGQLSTSPSMRGDGNDTVIGSRRCRHHSRRQRQRHRRPAAEATTRRCSAPTTTPTSGTPATAATPSRPGRHRYAAVQRREHQREVRHLRQRRARTLHPRCRQHHDGPQRHRKDQPPYPGRCRHGDGGRSLPAPMRRQVAVDFPAQRAAPTALSAPRIANGTAAADAIAVTNSGNDVR